MNLDEKILNFFPPEVVVRKDLAREKRIDKLPRYISEYLIAKFGRDDDLTTVYEIVDKYFVYPDEKEKYLSELMEQGFIYIIDEFRVRVDIKRQKYRLVIPSLNISDASVDHSLLGEHEKLLLGGVWGLGKLVYIRGHLDESTSPIILVELTPFQVSHIDLSQFIDARYEFSLNEWIDLLMRTLGLNPDKYSFEQKILIISRLIPLVEPNVYMTELGPKGTGKTSIYRNVSPYVRIISGGKISPAILFYNIGRKLVGLLGLKDVIVFDEISKVKLYSGDEIVAKLKDYMSTGIFERGDREFISFSSLVFIGNITIGEDGLPVSDNLFMVFPKEFRDPAFIDRIHGMLPGWRIPKIGTSKEYLAKGYGLVMDYFAEVLHRLRSKQYNIDISSYRKNDWTIRDEIALEKLIKGIMKILFPHGEYTSSEFTTVFKIIKNYRQIIVDQLHIIDPGEFKLKKL